MPLTFFTPDFHFFRHRPEDAALIADLKKAGESANI